jgi:hypothetical protein
MTMSIAFIALASSFLGKARPRVAETAAPA